MSQEPVNLRSLFCEALDRPTPGERTEFLDRACQGQPELRARVEALLQAHGEGGSFLGEREPRSVATVDDPVRERPGTVIGPYKLLEQIGEGGMGLVFVAEQQQPVRRRVALKIIKPGMDSRQVVARFEAERQALAMMDHPHIAKVFDGGATPEGRPYFVMELVRGTPITEYCDQHRLGTRQRLELFLDVCQAVQHAHQKGIIHRDLKPSNVLVSVHDVTPVVKVIDFGVAKAVGGRLTDKTVYTLVTQLVGTPLYMSPEQAGLSDIDVDTRSDVYSLGVLLYELLTCTTPFEKERFREAAYDEMRRMIREDEPPRPSTRLRTMKQADLSTIAERRGLEPRRLSQQLRGELDWVVMKALEKDRNRRYETASALAADVRRYLDDEPVQACPPSNGYRLRKFVRRNRASLTAAACVLIAVTVLGITVAWFLREKVVLQTQVEGEVKLALRDAELLQEQRKWAEAAAAARRAQGLLRTGTTDEALRQLVDRRVADLTLAADLDLIFTDRLIRLAERHWSTLSDPEIVRRYGEAFRNAGIDVQELSIEAAAERIRGRGIHAEIAAALDDWTAIRQYSNGMDDTFWKKLQQLATAVDPDPFRVQLRQAWAERAKDNKVVDVKKLLASPELLDQRIQVIHALADSVFFFGGNTKGWRELLLTLHRRHPEDFWINFQLGSEPGTPTIDALRFSTAAVALRPDNAGAHGYLSQALRLLRRFDEAIVECREAIRLRPNSAQGHLRLAMALHAKGLLDEAAVEYREASRLAPNEAEAHHELGLLLAAQGKLKDAIACFREAIRVEPWYAKAHNDLGTALKMQGQLNEAITHYRTAIRNKPDFALAHFNLGTARDDQEKYDEAIACFREAIRLKPNYAPAHNNLAWLRANCPDVKFRDPREAVSHAKTFIKLSPGDGDAWNTLGVAQYRNGDWKAAVEALTKSVQLHKGGDSFDFFFLAMAHWQLDDKEKARTWYDQAVAWMDKNKAQDKLLRRFRTEAAELLGVPKSAETQRDKK